MLLCSRAYCSSFLLAYGAEHLSKKYGAKFVGRTLLRRRDYSSRDRHSHLCCMGENLAAIGRGLGSNLLMMTLGLSIMLLIATTRLSKAPSKVWMLPFKLDKIFLLATAVISAGSVYRRLQLYRRLYLCSPCLELTL